MANTWFRKGEKRKVTLSAGGNESEIDFVLVGKGNGKYLRDVKVIPAELQHRLVVVDLVTKKVVWKLKEDDTRARFEERVGELSNGESNVYCKADGEKENRGPGGDVRIEGNSGSDGEWCEMVQACVEEG